MPLFGSRRQCASRPGQRPANIRICFELIMILYHMHILNSETIAGAQNSSCIMWLVNIFQYNCDVTCAVLKHLVKTF